MPKLQPTLAAAAFAAIVPLLPLRAVAADRDAPVRLAMMDMMPMGGDAAQQAAPGGAAMPGMPGAQAGAPGPGGMMDDDKMRMGGMAGQGQAQSQMPMGQAQQPMAGCDMMAMMRDMMMRRGAMPQGMQQGGAAPGMGAMGGDQPVGGSAARLEGRIAFLRTELRITDAQAPAWDTFANTLRAGREHLDAARAALQDSGRAADPMARLASFESHLRERTEAIHMTRMAFDTLYSQLDDAQKRTATATMLPFIGAF
ncbi:Spy/CpxP family protein refolding chaperone [Siccirubricoccus sp. KC 17139]|uniref:Spy/CpxP family protein refolding chaperone n=1 Tax=Siccirubricoccus soli TaxID=2899147 RepID=A0ABT1DBK2_9PROT|nr:Spy/CpxP family protein refolding chaperone [Siccirubricoccus soli]MCO6419321.1 Spy/CpxP family protein refolding chaperone [Siccirubricoccus soli]MCP2685456.1 Spy/CpxP family protein refolding chaperone [Siccirubricoccus soli]